MSWSQKVTNTSRALVLEEGVFTWKNSKRIAQSLYQSAKSSKTNYPYRSAMSMLSFYINRAGSQLSPTRKKILEKAKDELRKLNPKRYRSSKRSPKK